MRCSVFRQKCATSCTISPASYVLPYLMQHRLVKHKGTQYTPSSQRTRNNTLHKHGQRCWFESHISPIMHTCLPFKVGQGDLELWQLIKISNSCPLSEATTWGKLINCKVIILEQRLRLRLLTFALPYQSTPPLSHTRFIHLCANIFLPFFSALRRLWLHPRFCEQDNLLSPLSPSILWQHVMTTNQVSCAFLWQAKHHRFPNFTATTISYLKHLAS